DKDDLNNDQYRYAYTLGASGSYDYLFRAQLDGGPWMYCEADGPHDSFDAAAAGKLTVDPLQIAYCNLQSFPAGAEVETPVGLKGRVYVAGLTDRVGQGAGIRMQAAIWRSPSGRADGDWREATYEREADGRTPADHANGH